MYNAYKTREIHQSLDLDTENYATFSLYFAYKERKDLSNVNDLHESKIAVMIESKTFQLWYNFKLNDN